ncbi:hypothetical protein ES703_09596 [subsurface metagenome]
MNKKELPINTVVCGDALEVMKIFPDESIDCCITSPPYWGLRDYGFEQIFGGVADCEHEWEGKLEHNIREKTKHGKSRTTDRFYGEPSRKFNANIQRHQSNIYCSKCQAWKGQLGLEPTPELYIEHLTEIFNEAKRVLKKEGTLWLNIGDTYWSAKGSCFNPGGGKDSIETKRREIYPLNRGNKSDVPNLPQKCLTMVPERLAWSLIQNGWILRNKIVWFKPNSMPSSVKDRFSNRWEHIFLFSKSKKYYFDLDAVREPHKYDGRKDTLYKGGPKDMQIGKHERWPDPAGKNPGDVIETPAETRTLGAILGVKGAVKVPGGKGWVGHPPGGEHKIKHDPRWCPPEGKNPGDFFEITTQPFPEAHFAVFPEKLCEKPIKAGCPEQVCKRCGKARERITKLTYSKKRTITEKNSAFKKEAQGVSKKSTLGYRTESKTINWTSCDCDAGFEPGIVFDPFAGAGTVGVVAKKLGRRFILIDIKKEYCEMAKKRIAQVGYQMELRV